MRLDGGQAAARGGDRDETHPAAHGGLCRHGCGAAHAVGAGEDEQVPKRPLVRVRGAIPEHAADARPVRQMQVARPRAQLLHRSVESCYP